MTDPGNRKPMLCEKSDSARRRENIVAKDRHDRRYGFAVDTAGAIARALERAYRQGFAEAHSEPPAPEEPANKSDAAIEWALIPPRPRNAFWSICLFICGRPDLRACGGYLLPRRPVAERQGGACFCPSVIIMKKSSANGPSFRSSVSGFWSWLRMSPDVCWFPNAARRPGGDS